MVTSGDIDFTQINPRLGSKHAAFEEVCCQLAARNLPPDTRYTRLHGAGGDGGVECFADRPDGSRIGWQAKYVFDIDQLLRQATTSLATALEVHPTLYRYVLCFPFDLTGPTGRQGLSGVEKFTKWRNKQLSTLEGRDLDIEIWGAAQLRDLLLTSDSSGGMRSYFFGTLVLSRAWFRDRLDESINNAGPRYTADLNVRTEVGSWFSAFGRTAQWADEVTRRTRDARDAFEELHSTVTRTTVDPTFPQWPDDSREDALLVCRGLQEAADECGRLRCIDTQAAYEDAIRILQKGLDGLTELDKRMSAALESRHGPGTADSPGFRQRMSELFMTFPAHHLDELRKARGAAQKLCVWLEAPEAFLASERTFVLSGGWGVGKTHSACDVGSIRAEHDLLTCIVFGHEFDGDSNPWTRLAESLGLSRSLGRDVLLSALNCAAEASGHPLLLVFDAINETRPRTYWSRRIVSMIKEIEKYDYLRTCITCRTSFISRCLPSDHGLSIVTHPGFLGIERPACAAFFQHYGLKPPVAPILQSELSNPLYLKLLCETLTADGEEGLPLGWSSIDNVIESFIDRKEQEFAQEKDVNAGARLIFRCLRGVARSLAEEGQSKMPWSKVKRVVEAVDVTANNVGVVEWLAGEELLIEGGPDRDSSDQEDTLRLSFDRLGDFLFARELVDRMGDMSVASALQSGGVLRPLLRNAEQVAENRGVLSALSTMLPVREAGVELTACAGSGAIRQALDKITLVSLPNRDPATFSEATREVVRRGLATKDLTELAMDSLLAVAWHPSMLDATWLHHLLQEAPLAIRDSYWCGYLHASYEASGPPRRLIEAPFDMPLDAVDIEVAKRWAMMLAWFTAAADRRVRDWATRALTEVLVSHPAVVARLLRLFLVVDDDSVRVRVLLASYGAMLMSRNVDAVREAARVTHEAFSNDRDDFDNAMIRDFIRLLVDLARHLGVPSDGTDPELTMGQISSEWPLRMPTDDRVESWSETIRFRPNEFMSDFFKYSMECLRPWMDGMSKADMGKWIVERVARRFGYIDSGCENYDRYMVGRHGDGRGKPKWAERIGKKYQWMAMYQLASRLSDHVERKRETWETPAVRPPLILLEERKLDPTLPHSALKARTGMGEWWVGGSVDFGASASLIDEEWVAIESDVPTLEDMVALRDDGDQTWRPLVVCPSWSGEREGNSKSGRYRRVSILVFGYLVSEDALPSAYGVLCKRNFFGRWMPEGRNWTYGFLGEYPWAMHFDDDAEDGYGAGGSDPLAGYVACWGEIQAGWEYDASMAGSFGMIVPSREFFSCGELCWDGRDGFGIPGGRPVFRDPSVTNGGIAALLADAGGLLDRLKAMKSCLVWTLLGEKMIVGGLGDHQVPPLRTFSQVALMRGDGSLQFGETVFFDDLGQDKGLSEGMVTDDGIVHNHGGKLI